MLTVTDIDALIRDMRTFAEWRSARDDLIRQGLDAGMPAARIADEMQISISVVHRLRAGTNRRKNVLT